MFGNIKKKKKNFQTVDREKPREVTTVYGSMGSTKTAKRNDQWSDKESSDLVYVVNLSYDGHESS